MDTFTKVPEICLGTNKFLNKSNFKILKHISTDIQ